ncbi:MAG TPA: hypothetical protein VNL95_05245 [Dehalococcoidia bacterium]|nr:hypothetical protein [Dehalococcoidia bacterium]
MRPDQRESVLVVQGVLQELAREVSTDYARSQANMCLLLLQSVISEMDSAVHDLVQDTAALRELLAEARVALASLPDTEAADLAAAIGAALEEAPPDDLRLSSLRPRRERLLGLLERFLCLCEDRLGTSGAEALGPVRSSAYRLLRRMALRGWSFWDVGSFREALVGWRNAAQQEGA